MFMVRLHVHENIFSAYHVTVRYVCLSVCLSVSKDCAKPAYRQTKS